MTSVAATGNTPTGEPLIKVALVAVEVFGAECGTCETEVGYGLCDAVTPWSDCNRAVGQIFRRDDTEHRSPDHTITVYVPESELAKFDKRWGDDFDGQVEITPLDSAVRQFLCKHCGSRYTGEALT